MHYVYHDPVNSQVLCYYGQPPAPGERPVLTIANYTKWYHLCLILPGGTVQMFDDPRERYLDWNEVRLLENGRSDIFTDWYDHVPHPDYYAALCRTKNFKVCETSYQLILGRYVHELLLTSDRQTDVEACLKIHIDPYGEVLQR